MRHCAATLGSKERVGAVLQGLENARQGSRAPDAEARSCLAAQEATVRRLRLEHPTFRDLCYPFLCGLAQVRSLLLSVGKYFKYLKPFLSRFGKFVLCSKYIL